MNSPSACTRRGTTSCPSPSTSASVWMPCSTCCWALPKQNHRQSRLRLRLRYSRLVRMLRDAMLSLSLSLSSSLSLVLSVFAVSCFFFSLSLGVWLSLSRFGCVAALGLFSRCRCVSAAWQLAGASLRLHYMPAP